VEMNLDLIAAMYHLTRITGDPMWDADRARATKFVLSKFRREGSSTPGHFLAGEQQVIGKERVEWKDNTCAAQFPLDTSTWSVLVLGRTTETEESMRWAEASCRVQSGPGGFSGYAFSALNAGSPDKAGCWSEGMGQVVLAYRLLDRDGLSHRCLDELRAIQAASPGGGVVAATLDGLDTGFDVGISSGNGTASGVRWRYFAQNHLAPLAWLIFAEYAWSPFYQMPVTTPPPPAQATKGP
jgi:hypothetical protein